MPRSHPNTGRTSLDVVQVAALLGCSTAHVYDLCERGSGDERAGWAWLTPHDGVTAIQRFGGALNLNVHFHTLIPDGSFVISDDGTIRFLPLPAPSDEEVDAILRRVIRRAAKAVSSAVSSEDREDALAELQAAD